MSATRDINQVSIGNGYKLAVNVPGSQLFSAPGNDVFLAINNLIHAVQTNSGIPAAVNALTAASSYLSAQRVFYGNAVRPGQSQTTYLTTAQLQISEQQTTLGGADLAAAATNLTQAQTDTQAATGRHQQVVAEYSVRLFAVRSEVRGQIAEVRPFFP